MKKYKNYLLTFLYIIIMFALSATIVTTLTSCDRYWDDYYYHREYRPTYNKYYCGHCGAEVDRYATRCPYCGAWFE